MLLPMRTAKLLTCAALSFATACGGSDDEAAVHESSKHARLFDEVWEIMQAEYPYFEHKGVDWHALRTTCRPSVQPLDSSYATWRDEAMDCLLAPLVDYHVNIFDPNGTAHGYGLSGYNANFDVKLVGKYLEADGTSVADGVVIYGKTVSGGFGYVRVASWSPDAVAQVDFAAIRSVIGAVPGYIVDVRRNGGGSTNEAERLVGELLSSTEPYGWARVRQEVDGDPLTHELGQPRALKVRPDRFAADPFAGPVALLIGQGCVSSCELFSLMMELSPNMTSFGATTRGASGNPDIKTLSNGAKLRHSTSLMLLSDAKTVLEWRGVEPDVPVAFTGGASDQVLDAAIKWLETAAP